MRGLSTIFWIACVLSLMLMFLGLVPLWCVGKQGNFTMHVATCLGGLAVCCICLWLRCCWLFDVHHITATGRQLLFPDILIPSILVLGTTVGNWGLGDLLLAPRWAVMLVTHTVFSAMIGVLVGLLVVAGLNYRFQRPDLFSV